MIRHEFYNILTLLAMVILTDDVTYPDEGNTFALAAVDMTSQLFPKTPFTMEAAEDWFTANKVAVQGKITGEDADHLMRRLVWELENTPHRKTVFEDMVKIVQATGQNRAAEHTLIRLAADIWDRPYRVDEKRIAG